MEATTQLSSCFESVVVSASADDLYCHNLLLIEVWKQGHRCLNLLSHIRSAPKGFSKSKTTIAKTTKIAPKIKKLFRFHFFNLLLPSRIVPNVKH